MSIKWIIEKPYYMLVFVISINNRSQYALTSKEMSSTEKSMLHIPGRPAVIYYSLFRIRKKYIYYQRRSIHYTHHYSFDTFPRNSPLTFSLFNIYVSFWYLKTAIILFLYKNKNAIIIQLRKCDTENKHHYSFDSYYNLHMIQDVSFW